MSDNFFSRWSRRKQAQAQDQTLESDTALPESLAPKQTPSGVRGSGNTTRQMGHDGADQPLSGQSAVPPSGAADEPLPTLDEARTLTPESDFQPYMRQGVTPAVRNVAMKKLFADPHFNVMDGLDIYIGDYTQADPLPPGMLEKMVGAQFLKLVPPETPDKPDVATQSAEAPVNAATDQAPGSIASSPQNQQAPSVVAQSPDSPADMATNLNLHDHPDLQLQPDPAAADPQAGSGPR